MIDVGTNSVKLHVGERRADGTWSTVVDRAIVTRLGEGLDATGALGPEPMERTLEAIATAGRRGAARRRRRDRGGRHRRAARRGERRRVRRAPSRRAAASGSRSSPARRRAASPTSRPRRGSAWPRGSLVVFDTGGGSSQFTFGRRRRRSRSSSACRSARSRLTERYGLDGAVSEEALARRARRDRRRARPPRRPPLARRARRDGRRA